MSKLHSSIHDLIYDRQHARILRLSFPNGDGPAPPLLVNKIEAKESLSKDFVFTVELLSDDSNIALKELHGRLLSIEMVRRDGSLRYFSGYVFSFGRVILTVDSHFMKPNSALGSNSSVCARTVIYSTKKT